MKSRSFLSILHILMVSSLLLSITQPISNVYAAGAGPILPVSKLLNADGTLNLATGYSGAVDAGNYSVRLDPAHGPVFSPLMTVNAWSSLGSGLNNIVYAIAVNGSNVYVGGQFTDAGGNVNADRIAMWNGSTWSALGSGISNGQVNALAFNGSVLYVGGNFTTAGGVSGANYIAQWNGSSWSTLGDGLGNTVNAISVSGLNIYIAGNFTNAGVDVNADYIAKLDGGTWAALGATPLNGPINSIAVAGSFVYAGGDFLDAGGNPNADRIALWDGSSWSPLGSGLGATVVTIALSGSDVYAGGLFNDAGGNTNADKIAKWDGASWSALGSGLSSFVNIIVVNGSNVYAGGNFINAGSDLNADYIARWDGTAWSALGATPLSSTVSAMAINGLDVYVGGIFNDAGDSNGDKIALFQLDGTAPTVVSFSATSPTNSLNIPITAFTASDNVAVTGYKITEDNTPPAAGDAGWTVSPPGTYTVPSAGSYTLYPWVKDGMGNISAVYGTPVSVTVDIAAPTVNTFTATSPSTSLNIPITAFTASDNVGVSGYKITETSTVPSVGSGGWAVSSPTTYTVPSDGSYTLYPWAKDAAGNVSALYGVPVSVTVDTTAPTTTSFARQSPSVSTTNADVLVFRVSFSEAVTGVGTADFAVTGTTAAVDSISLVGTGIYDVHIDGTNGINDGNLASYNGVVGLDFSGGMSIKDLAGNNLANSEPATDETYTLDNSPTVTPTPTETATAIITETNTVTATPTVTETETPTVTITPTSTGTETPTVTITPTVTRTMTPTATRTATRTATKTRTKTPTPVTIRFTSLAAQDGWVLESGENASAGGTINSVATTFNLGDNAARKQYRGILSFNTSSIPDTATITGVILKVKQQAIVGGGNPVIIFGGFMADIKNGFFGASALQTTDFQMDGSGIYGPFIVGPFSGVYSISLTSGKAFINKLTANNGLTQIRLRFKLDDNNNALANYLSLYSGNAVNAADRPQLLITYTVP